MSAFLMVLYGAPGVRFLSRDLPPRSAGTQQLAVPFEATRCKGRRRLHGVAHA